MILPYTFLTVSSHFVKFYEFLKILVKQIIFRPPRSAPGSCPHLRKWSENSIFSTFSTQKVRKHIFTRGKHTTIPPGIFFHIIRTSFNEPTPQITIPGPKTRFSIDISLIFVISYMYENVRKFKDFQQFRPKK